ncbi:MAG: hypothetical protein R3F05_02415 [Planctomycetota bacterium]
MGRRSRVGKAWTVCALALVLVVSPAVGRAQDDARHRRAIGRYVMVTGAVPQRHLDLGVQLGDQLVDWLRKRWPGDPLWGRGRVVVRLHPTIEAYRATLRRLGASNRSVWTSAGVAYHHGRSCDLHLQATDELTQHVLLHELTHVIQARLCGPYRGGLRWSWYWEGLAEAFSQYSLRANGTARFAALEQDDPRGWPSKAAKRVAAVGYDPVLRVLSAEPLDYVDAYALVAAMMRLRDPDLAARWALFEAKVKEGAHETNTFVRLFRHRRLRLAAEIRRVWAVDGPQRRRP